MKSTWISFLALTFVSLQGFAQAPILYINFVSHNEPVDSLHLSSNYFDTKPKCIDMANLIKSKGAAWNLGTCDYFMDGAINHDQATTSNNDIFELLSQSTYSSNIEIDPRIKNHLGRNTADAAHMIGLCGGTASDNVSGFTYWSSNPMQIDWWRFQDTMNGNFYFTKWKAKLIWGGGSPNHVNDLNDYGIWKPDTTTNFYTHNPDRTLWFEGNGCAPKLDTLTDEQEIISQLRGFIDSLQSGDLPQDKFYCYTIALGQDEFGPTLFGQIGTVIDSVNSWDSTAIQWATLTQKFDLFQAWQAASQLEYSQWLCGQVPSGVETSADADFNIYPNPSQGRFSIQFPDDQAHRVQVFSANGSLVFENDMKSGEELDLGQQAKGLYLVKMDYGKAVRVLVD